MKHFVSMVSFNDKLLGMTDTGAVWQFHPGFDGCGVPNGEPKWTHLSDGPQPQNDAPNPCWHTTVDPVTEFK